MMMMIPLVVTSRAAISALLDRMLVQASLVFNSVGLDDDGVRKRLP